ncbi:MAG: CoA-binding protein [Saprospiraceae bacterium]|nr:CoA-binding protein [Saprospiraceae bacterium]
MKKTVVMGATPNPGRYAYLVTQRLAKYGHEVVPVGLRKGNIGDIEIQEGQPEIEDVDTVTLYMGEERQKPVEDYILSLHPKRIIFNPGAENPALEKKANAQGIETIEGCTLVMLAIGNY